MTRHIQTIFTSPSLIFFSTTQTETEFYIKTNRTYNNFKRLSHYKMTLILESKTFDIFNRQIFLEIKFITDDVSKVGNNGFLCKCAKSFNFFFKQLKNKDSYFAK